MINVLMVGQPELRNQPDTRGMSLLLVGVEEGEDSKYATVIVGCRRDFQFREDVLDVLLNGVLGDKQPFGDGLVRAPLGHESEDLPLALSELLKRVLTTTRSAHELRDDRRIEHGPSLRHPAEALGQLPDV